MCLTLFRQLNFFRYIVLKIENRSSETKAHILKKNIQRSQLQLDPT